jgi:hypothetical protein
MILNFWIDRIVESCMTVNTIETYCSDSLVGP